MNPGRYINLSNQEYHGGPGISKSGLDRIARSPAHYQAYLKKSPKQTDDLLFGSLVHTLALEPAKFEGAYIVAPKCDRRTKEGKAAWAAFEEASGGRTIVEEGMYAEARVCADAVAGNPRASELLSAPGTAEESFYWRDASEGVLCRCRPDFLQADGGYLVDLKTTRDASAFAFGRSAAEYRYHVQAAFYLDGVEAVTGVRPKGFVFIAVEKTQPYAVAVYEALEDSIGEGRAVMRRDLRAYAECFFSGVWPGYPDAITPLALPGWAFSAGARDGEVA